MEYLDIINIETDEVVGSASHDEVYEKKLPHRIVHVIVYRKNGNIVLQKRSPKKYFHPNSWATSACGHVSSGESYEVAAVRETQEEIGITPEISPIQKFRYSSEYGIEKMLAIFKTETEEDFHLNFEVSQVREFSLKEILKIPRDNIHPELLYLIDNNYL